MFKRVFAEEWTLCLPFVAFFLFAAVFAAVTIRALRLEKSERARLASLPLDESNNSPSTPATDN